MSTVYVLNKDGKPLMPTTRGGHVRHLLKEQKARVVRAKPFTIQLLYETNDVVQPLYLGIDPGRTNIGVAVVKANGTAVFTAHLETRNKEVPKLMQDRKKARRARRTNGRRCRRQRRAKANGTISKKCVKQDTAQSKNPSKRAKEIGIIKRRLPGYKKDVLCIGIKNKEAKYTNRTRPEGWLTPTANQLLQTHINLVRKIQKFLPISDVVLEVNKFAFMRLDNPDIQKWQYQQGPLYQKGSLENAVSEIPMGQSPLSYDDGSKFYSLRSVDTGKTLDITDVALQDVRDLPVKGYLKLNELENGDTVIGEINAESTGEGVEKEISDFSIHPV